LSPGTRRVKLNLMGRYDIINIPRTICTLPDSEEALDLCLIDCIQGQVYKGPTHQLRPEGVSDGGVHVQSGRESMEIVSWVLCTGNYIPWVIVYLEMAGPIRPIGRSSERNDPRSIRCCYCYVRGGIKAFPLT